MTHTPAQMPEPPIDQATIQCVLEKLQHASDNGAHTVLTLWETRQVARAIGALRKDTAAKLAGDAVPVAPMEERIKAGLDVCRLKYGIDPPAQVTNDAGGGDGVDEGTAFETLQYDIRNAWSLADGPSEGRIYSAIDFAIAEAYKRGFIKFAQRPQTVPDGMDINAISWAYEKLMAFGLATSETNAHMLDRLKLMVLKAASPQQITEGKHAYAPDKKFPWFCGKCGYAKHEKLKHSDAAAPQQEGAE